MSQKRLSVEFKDTPRTRAAFDNFKQAVKLAETAGEQRAFRRVIRLLGVERRAKWDSDPEKNRRCQEAIHNVQSAVIGLSKRPR